MAARASSRALRAVSNGTSETTPRRGTPAGWLMTKSITVLSGFEKALLTSLDPALASPIGSASFRENS